MRTDEMKRVPSERHPLRYQVAEGVEAQECSDRLSLSSETGAPNLGDTRVVLVHDWLTGMRGGEKVLEVLCELFPEAPLFTLLHVRGSVSSVIENRTITTSPLQRMPWAAKRYRHYLPLFPAFAEMTKVRDCDLVISTSHAVAKAMVARSGSGPRHICYLHTPMRYIWDRFDDYFGGDRVGKMPSRFFFRPIARALQGYDLRTNERVDVFVANSRFVAARVKRLYGRTAEVVAPPVDVEHFSSLERKPEDWYLVVSALVPYKRVDHAIAACAALRKPLKIVGSGPEAEKLAVLARELGCQAEFLGFVSDEDLVGYYSRARALLFPGIEDFGIVPVEAMAAGCPVIALGEGGILDSMAASTGVLYSEENVEALKAAICEFESRSFDTAEIRKRSRTFSKDAFVSGFNAVLREVMTQI
jgi:glycosyltransferase involved in cell wall biosynthesis